MFAWILDRNLLGDGFIEPVAWGCCFQGLICLGTLILITLLLGDLLGMGLVRDAIQGEEVRVDSDCLYFQQMSLIDGP